MRLLVTGSNGQVGQALVPALSRLGEVIALDRAACDLGDPGAIAEAVRSVKPDIIVNPAAYTAVDKAESDREAAFAVNARAPATLARLAAEAAIPLIHYSTDYVFEGTKDAPYTEDDPTGPLSVYGASKLEGENAIRALHPHHVILRTSWVFSAHGANFLKTILRLANQRDRLAIVADQIGAPTPAHLIASATAAVIGKLMNNGGAFGTFHLTSSGETSWHGYAQFLLETAHQMGMPLKVAQVDPIPTSDYPMPAVRPANSRLDCTKLTGEFAITLPPWQDGVVQVLEHLAKS